jgi:hypothetical protein
VSGLFCVGVVVALIIGAIVKAFGAGSYNTLMKTGVPARGILLSVNSFTAGRAANSGMRFELRQVTIDVEIPGKPPYEVTCQLMIPAQLRNDILPGATVELRVDPRRGNQIAVVGPGAGVIGASMGLTK